MSNIVRLNPEYFPSPTISRALSGASIYVGIVDLDPKIPANQKTLSVLQEDGTTVTVTQPISTNAGGIPVYNGSPVTMLVDGNYSLRVDDSTGVQKYYVPQSIGVDSFGSIDSIAALKALTETALTGQIISVLGYYGSTENRVWRFKWDTSDLTSEVTADPQSGIYVAPDSDATGASGAWVRLNPEYNFDEYGAKGDGTTDDSAAIEAAYDAAPTGSVLTGTPGKTYIWDFELYILKKITLDFTGVTIKLPDQSSLFHSSELTTRYMIHIRHSDVEIKGATFEGNSPNNWYEPGDGKRYYLYSSPPNVFFVGIIVCGWIDDNASEDINNINIHDNTFNDSPGQCIDSSMTDSLHRYRVRNLSVNNNTFKHGQGVNVALTHVASAAINNNTFLDPYDFTVQPYVWVEGVSITGNTTDFASSRINFAEVDWTNKDAATGLVSLWFGQMRIGKNNLGPAYGITVAGNTFNGAMLQIVNSVGTTITGNSIYNSEGAGIDIQMSPRALGDATTSYDITDRGSNIFRYTYNGTGTDPGITNEIPWAGSRVLVNHAADSTNGGYHTVTTSSTDYFEVFNPNGVVRAPDVLTITWSVSRGLSISNNTIVQAAGPGINCAESYSYVEINNNILIGNNTSSDDWGGRALRANISILSSFYNLKDNSLRANGLSPLYGIHIVAGISIANRNNGSEDTLPLLSSIDNDILDSGITSDLYDPDGNFRGNVQIPVIESIYNPFSFLGKLGETKMFTYQNDAIADDGTVTLPDATSGMCFVSCNDESGMWLIKNDGSVVKVVGTANTGVTNPGASVLLSVYDFVAVPNTAVVINALGVAGEIRVVYFYN